MATALGRRVLVRYYEGTATRDQLDSALTKNWITQAEHDRAVAGEPPEGYQPPAAAAETTNQTSAAEPSAGGSEA